MTTDQWRELIDSYLSGRLSADSFKRRFLEAFSVAVARREAVPPSVQALAYVVEAYAGDPMARGHDVTDDADLLAAARVAQTELAPAQSGSASGAGPSADHSTVRIEEIDPEAVRQHMRKAAFTVGAAGAAGCGLALAYLAVGVLQLFAVADQIQSVTDLGPVIATIGGVALAFIPILGGTIAYFGATDVWGWPNLTAGIVFFAFPIAILCVGFLQRRTLIRGRRW